MVFDIIFLWSGKLGVVSFSNELQYPKLIHPHMKWSTKAVKIEKYYLTFQPNKAKDKTSKDDAFQSRIFVVSRA